MTPPLVTSATDRLDPVRLVCLVALVASHGLVRLAERYLPAFVTALGHGPLVVGALVTLGLGVAAAGAEYTTDAIDEGATTDRERTAIAVLAALLGAVGLLAWAGAPTLDTLLGTPLTSLGWLAVGAVVLQTWHVAGPVRHLWPVDIRIASSPASAADEPDGNQAGADDGDRERTPRRARAPDRRMRIVVGALGIAAAAVVATAAVASADGVRAGFALVAATGAAVAVVGAVTLGTVGDRSTLSVGRLATASGDRKGAGSDADAPLTVVRRAVSRLPDRRRWAVVGDALVRVAIAGAWPYLILLVVDYRPLARSVGGLSLGPAAVFGLFVLAEAVGAIAGAIAAPALAARVDRRALLIAGLAGLSLVPLALAAAPASVGVVAVLFVLAGCRSAIEPLRPTVGAGVRAAPVPGPRLPDAVRTGVRLAVVPAPLVGGLLYAIDPLVAFTVATTVGLLGVRELGRAFTFARR